MKDRKVGFLYETRDGRSREYEAPYEGVVKNLERRYRESDSDFTRMEIERYMANRPCGVCKGSRLKPESLAVTVGDLSIIRVTSMSVRDAADWFRGLMASLSDRDQTISRQILKEIRARLGFLVDVGLEYLTLDRPAGSLSGGEAQRIRLATQIGSSLMGVLYIL